MSEQAAEYRQHDPITFRPISEREAVVKSAITEHLAHDSSFKNSKGEVEYTFTSSDGILNFLRPLLAKEQLSVRTSILDYRIETIEVTRYNKPEKARYAMMKAAIWLACPGTLDACNATGETREEATTWWIEHPYRGPQTTEAMVTYIEKMFLKARFQISTGVDIQQGGEEGVERTNGAQQPAKEDPRKQAEPPAQQNGAADPEREKAKETYRDFKARVGSCKTRDDLKAFEKWWDENTERYNALPKAGQDELQAAYQACMKNLQEGQPA